MNMELCRQTLQGIQTLFADERNWARGHVALNWHGTSVNAHATNAVKWCFEGAIRVVTRRVAGEQMTGKQLADDVRSFLAPHVQRHGHENIPALNDKCGLVVVRSVIEEALATIPSSPSASPADVVAGIMSDALAAVATKPARELELA